MFTLFTDSTIFIGYFRFQSLFDCVLVCLFVWIRACGRIVRRRNFFKNRFKCMTKTI